MRSASPREVVFDGQDLAVVVRQSARKRGVITFSSWSADPPGLAPADTLKGMIEGLLDRTGYDEFHVISRRNHWYQTDEREAVLALARHFASARNVVTYGSSMGGYGAAVFSHLLELRCIAIVPQYSMNSRIAPFETRWRRDVEAIRSFETGLISTTARASGYVFYDPFTKLDAQQADLFRANTNYILVPCSFSGHKSVKIINRAYGLGRLIDDIAEGVFSPHEFREALKKEWLNDEILLENFYLYASSHGFSMLADRALRRLLMVDGKLTLNSLQRLLAISLQKGDLKVVQHWTEAIARLQDIPSPTSTPA